MQNMDPIKLELIKMAAAQTAGKSGKDLAPILFALITNAGKHNIQFSPEEITLILDLLKEGKSDSEKAQIDRTVKEEGIKPSSFHFIAFCLVFLYNIELESNIQEDFYADSHAYS